MTVSNELIDQLLAGCKKPENLIGENGLLKQLTKRLVKLKSVPLIRLPSASPSVEPPQKS